MIILVTPKNLTKVNINSILISKDQIINDLKNNPFGAYLLYQKDQKIVGYLYYSKIYDRIEVNEIEVLKIYRRQNIASSMLEYLLINISKDITLEVRESNYPAINLYKKFGFTKLAIRKNYYKNEDALLMGTKKPNS